MRLDQFEALQQRAEQLVDLFISESDPDKWPGKGLEPGQMDQKTRGDRYWCKKDAVATLACAQRIGTLVDLARRKTAAHEDTPEAVTEGEDDLDKEIRAAEKEAAKIINGAASKARKSEFDKRVHGKT
ncbi:MAG TPA: hypothetical protein DCP71_13165 [Verrucomicrobiales bacterium]|nr:hypothetical protein [Verrucomicrobiales bacterium]